MVLNKIKIIVAKALPVLNTNIPIRGYSIKHKLWENIVFPLKDNILNKEILTKFINEFYSNIVSKIDDNQHIAFLFKFQYTNNDTKTVSKLQKINKEGKNELISFIFDALSLTLDNYNESLVKSLIITYGIRKGNIDSIFVPAEGRAPLVEACNYHLYFKHKLPIALNIKDYGTIFKKIDDLIFINHSKNITLIIKIKDNTHKIEYFKNGKLFIDWIDHIKEDGSLIREVGKTTILWKDGEIIWTKILRPNKFIAKKKTSSNFKKNYITMDIETFGNILDNNNTILNPYLLCWYDGKRDKKYSYFINPNNSLKNIISQVMNDICIRKYKGYKIYLHNFSKFDAIFIIKYLVDIGKCKPIIHKDKIISFSFSPNWKKDFGNIVFLDSFLLLPSSLKKLSQSFKIDNPKEIFPVLFNDINYKGIVPEFKYFKGVSLEEYNDYKEQFLNKIWNFKLEAELYCILDCKSLYQILNKFSQIIFDKFKLNITDYPTLSSLAFAIFRAHYLKYLNIAQISGSIEREIRLGYTGGSTDMFIPKSIENKKLYAYDVNSLYPSVMLNNPFPVGNPTYFEGDIMITFKNPFGFFYCKITTPLDLKYPILQLHYNNRTVSPLGVFEGWFFSEELYNAKKYGYSFEIIRGYLFEKDNIFKGYVNDLYQLRLDYPKNDPMNLVAKLLLNSLYGRFGMNDNFNKIKIMNQKEYLELEKSNFNIESIKQLNNKYLVSYSPQNKIEEEISKNNHNINIAIAAAVTAYARIHMTQFKNNPLLPNLYYSDTDSLYFDGEIPDKFVDPKKLGALKLEGVYDDAIFLAPKLYALKNNDGEIIKIKGLTKEAIVNNNISFELLKNLLNKDYNLILKQKKWFRSLSKANIEILEQTYNLKITENKRELIYKNNILVETKPFNIDLNN